MQCEKITEQLGLPLYIHQMLFDDSDVQQVREYVLGVSKCERYSIRMSLYIEKILKRQALLSGNYSTGSTNCTMKKLIHPYSIAELRKYRNPQMQSLYDAKIDAYTEMRCIAPQTAEFTALLSDTPKTANDQIDNQLLCELYCKRADILITEDRRMRLKADRLGLSERVFTINSFIEKCTNENPDLIDYKVLAVKKELFGNIDVADPFLLLSVKHIRDSRIGL